MRLLWIVVLALLAVAAPVSACRQALVIALDVSGSVDATEYQQQVNGLAFALGHPDVKNIILADLENPIMITVFEWSSQNHQYVILPWSRLDSAMALDTAIERISSHRKVRAGLKTALGTALAFGQSMLAKQTDCWQHTIDVSGDGRNNSGPSPPEVYASGFGRAIVNGLVVGNPEADSAEGPGIQTSELHVYFENEVIRGPGAFSIVAKGYTDYARAMKVKLEKELQLPVIGKAETKSELPG